MWKKALQGWDSWEARFPRKRLWDVSESCEVVWMRRALGPDHGGQGQPCDSIEQVPMRSSNFILNQWEGIGRFYLFVLVFNACAHMYLCVHVHVCRMGMHAYDHACEGQRTSLGILLQEILSVLFVWGRVSHWPGTQEGSMLDGQRASGITLLHLPSAEVFFYF